MTAVAALTAGASAADVSMNVIGHHCGHIRLSEVVLVLEGLYGISTGIKLERLKGVSQLVRQRSGIHLSIDKPVVGDYAFRTDGAYWAAEADLPYSERVHATFPFPPYLVGSEERVIWSGKTITRDSVETKLSSMGLGDQKGKAGAIISRLVEVLEAKDQFPNWISDSEFEALCRAVVSEESQHSS
jgi:isopropylmalate/homocitrate/citramalate synthase